MLISENLSKARAGQSTGHAAGVDFCPKISRWLLCRSSKSPKFVGQNQTNSPDSGQFACGPTCAPLQSSEAEEVFCIKSSGYQRWCSSFFFEFLNFGLQNVHEPPTHVEMTSIAPARVTAPSLLRCDRWLRRLLLWLDISTLSALCRVCKTFRVRVDDDGVWKDVWFRDAVRLWSKLGLRNGDVENGGGLGSSSSHGDRGDGVKADANALVFFLGFEASWKHTVRNYSQCYKRGNRLDCHDGINGSDTAGSKPATASHAVAADPSCSQKQSSEENRGHCCKRRKIIADNKRSTHREMQLKQLVDELTSSSPFASVSSENASEMTPGGFIRRYEKKGIPVVIRDALD